MMRRQAPQNTAHPAGLIAGCLIMLLAPPHAWAGPPYVTDDPEPTRTGGWENYLFATGTNTPGTAAGQAGVELNYGAATNLQLSLTLPEGYAVSHRVRAGAGDLDLGVKYRLLQASNDSWLPDMAVFPSLAVPTGTRSFGTGHIALFLPVWLEKDFGRWSAFGGGGFGLQSGARQRNYALSGIALTRSCGPRLNLGIEIYHQTRIAPGGPAETNLGLGAIYQMTKHWAVMTSAGPNLDTAARSGAWNAYISLQFTN